MTDQQLKAKLDQDKKVEELYSLYKQGEKDLGFFGKAGVGKTYCTRLLVDRIKSEVNKKELKIIGAAISHSAKNILKTSLGLDIDVMTVASMLQLKKVINPLTGEFDFLPEDTYKMVSGKMKKVPPPITYADIIIIDECSQINSKTKKLINDYRKSNSVIIYLGDWHQTPPVEDDNTFENRDSSTFNVPNVILKIPYRYEGELEHFSDAVALEIDKFNEYGDCDFKFLVDFITKKSDSYKFYRNEVDFYDKAIECFKSSNDLKNCVVVCYRNETVFNDNLKLKKEILNTTESYTIGEKIVAKSSFFDEFGGLIIQNNSLYTVLEKQEVRYAFIATKDGKFITQYELGKLDTERNINSKYPESTVIVYVDAYKLKLKDVRGEELDSIVISLKDSTDKKFFFFKNLVHSRCKKIKDDWKDFYRLEEYFTPFDSAYVVNTYVVQGDTYENVFVNFRDILSVKPITRKEKLQSLYTAITRAKKHVSILV
jgi:hypothetical protein